MMENSPLSSDKLHSIENNRTNEIRLINTNRNIAINTDSTLLHRDVCTNTPNYAEQISRELEKGNSTDEIMQMLMENETSESYWKLITERRKQAIDETIKENNQLHKLIDELNKENNQLRLLSNHCDYLQNILNSFTNEHDSLLDDH